MPVLSPNSVSILPPNQTSGGSLKEKSSGLRYNTQKSPDAALWSTAADAFSNAQSQIDNITNALRTALPQPSVFQITDRSGALVAEIGNLTGSNNQAFEGIWGKNLYVGGTGPDNAPFFANGQQVIIGQNGQVFVLDPYGDIGAWLGTQSELPKNVTGAANNGSGAIRLTVTAHGWVTGDQVHVANVGGVPNAAGQWVITVIDPNTIDLIGSTFAGGYAGGGTAQRYFTGGLFSTIAVGGSQAITNVVNNGAGLARITVPSNGYLSGYSVVLTGINGVPNINGVSWNITVIDPNTFDLIGSVFSGAYTGGGLSLNWPTAKLIARDDGSLTINGATLILNANGVTTEISNAPSNVIGWPGQASSLISLDNATGAYSEIDPFHVAVVDSTGLPIIYMENNSGGRLIAKTALNIDVTTLEANSITVAHNAGTTHQTMTMQGDGIGISQTGTTTRVDLFFNKVTVLSGGVGVTLSPTNVDSLAYSVAGTPGIDLSTSFGASLSVGTGSAITSVTGPGVTGTTSGVFVTGVTLNLTGNTFSKGLLTA